MDDARLDGELDDPGAGDEPPDETPARGRDDERDGDERDGDGDDDGGGRGVDPRPAGPESPPS
jgi:hypothetical protein